MISDTFSYLLSPVCIYWTTKFLLHDHTFPEVDSLVGRQKIMVMDLNQPPPPPPVLCSLILLCVPLYYLYTLDEC
jgi:hypothetical protein